MADVKKNSEKNRNILMGRHGKRGIARLAIDLAGER
jgi:hypothetical protein